MFDIRSVPKVKVKEGEVGRAKIQPDIGDATIYLLTVDDEQWMSVNTRGDMNLREFYSSYDLAKGNVFMSGFGLGILPQWIATKPEVTSVTVVEKFNDVVELFLLNNELNSKIKVVISDVYEYTSTESYDWAILDHYELDRVPTKENLSIIENNINFKNLWFWSLEPYMFQFKTWKELRENFSLKIPELSKEQLKIYFKTLFRKREFPLQG